MKIQSWFSISRDITFFSKLIMKSCVWFLWSLTFNQCSTMDDIALVILMCFVEPSFNTSPKVMYCRRLCRFVFVAWKFCAKIFYGHPHLWLPMVLTCKYQHVTQYKTLDSIYNMWTHTLQICLFRESDIQRDIANIKHEWLLTINWSIRSTYGVSFYTMHWLPTVPQGLSVTKALYKMIHL